MKPVTSAGAANSTKLVPEQKVPSLLFPRRAGIAAPPISSPGSALELRNNKNGSVPEPTEVKKWPAPANPGSAIASTSPSSMSV